MKTIVRYIINTSFFVLMLPVLAALALGFAVFGMGARLIEWSEA